MKLVSRLKDFIKEATKVPPEEEKQEEETHDVEEQEEMITDEPEEELITDEDTTEYAREEVLGMLNTATKSWKETGDLGVKFKQPKPSLKTRLRAAMAQIRMPSLKIPKEKKKETKPEKPPSPPDGPKSIDQTWTEVNKRLEHVPRNRERQEIEQMIEQLDKVYKQS